MEKNDYYVIVYRILAYLYRCMKEGRDFNPVKIEAEALGINEKYWRCIMNSITDASGYFNWINITPKGIEYLFTDPMMKKACDFLKANGEKVPLDLL